MRTLPELVAAVGALQRQVDGLAGKAAAAELVAVQEDAKVPPLAEAVRVLTLGDAALVALLAKVSEESLRSVEGTITYGLRVVFDDHPLAFRFRSGTARGGQVLEPVLQFEGVEQPILDAFGGGPAQVVAFLLRLLVCHRLGLYPLILLDETFSMVSRQYVPNLAKLLRELAGQMGFTFVLVTHQTDFVEHASRAYEVQEGTAGASFAERTA